MNAILRSIFLASLVTVAMPDAGATAMPAGGGIATMPAATVPAAEPAYYYRRYRYYRYYRPYHYYYRPRYYRYRYFY